MVPIEFHNSTFLPQEKGNTKHSLASHPQIELRVFPKLIYNDMINPLYQFVRRPKQSVVRMGMMISPPAFSISEPADLKKVSLSPT